MCAHVWGGECLCTCGGRVVVHEHMHTENLPGLGCCLLCLRSYLQGGYWEEEEDQINPTLSFFPESH
jgi:hypothetical protein